MKRLATILAVSVFLVGGVATGQPTPESTCVDDADCPGAFVCVHSNEAICSDCSTEECPPCEYNYYSYCEPAPPASCASDSDCEVSEVCVSYEYESCSGVAETDACTANPITGSCADECEYCEESPAEEYKCTTNREAFCVPRFIAPCVADADCGGGFTCEAPECLCLDAPIPLGGDGSTGDEGEPHDCECDSDGVKSCRLVEVACDSDAACAGELTCQDVSNEYPILIVEDCSDSDCSTVPPSADPDPVLRCAPEDYEFWGDYSSESESSFKNGDRVAWSEDANNDGTGKKESTGCSATGTAGSGGLVPMLLALGFFGFRRRRD